MRENAAVHPLSITLLSGDEAAQAVGALGALLRDAVEGGASVGFVVPLAEDVIAAYWAGIVAEVARGTRLLLVARQGAQIVGTAQLDLVQRPNSLHRAEVQRVLVLSRARRAGIARALMLAVEEAARARGRTLLVLDTQAGSAAEPLYRGLGYTEAGRIPDYAGAPDGSLIATVIFYKHI
ncbi:MAG: GNAT family N-acetyltransferase [Ktedonobacterales bacterium]|nr:GNAT family N-acetyltransferase [Ktedonobacterales bacterium]